MKFSVCFLAISTLFTQVVFGQTPDFSWAVSGVAGSAKVVVDNDQNSIVTGNFFITGTFGPGLEYSDIQSKGSYDIFIEKLDSNGALVWLYILGSSESEMVEGIATDLNGNIYLTGSFWGVVDVDFGEGVYEITPTEGFDDIFVLKLNPNGEFLWVKTMGSYTFDSGSVIKVDAQENVYLAGQFGHYLNDMDPGSGEYVAEYFGSYSDVFLMKLDAQGTFLWLSSLGGDESDWINDIAIDNSGNVYTTGGFTGTAECSCDTTFVSNGSRDVFVQKFTSNGDLEWGYSFGSAQLDDGQVIQVDENGDVLVAGNFFGTLDLDPGLQISEFTSHGGDIFLQKLTSEGSLIWVKTIGGNGLDHITDLTIDQSNNLYITGTFSGQINLGTNANPNIFNSIGIENAFVQKMDNNGNPLWGMTVPVYSKSGTIEVDELANTYVTGEFRAPNDFDPNAEKFMIYKGNYFVMRLGFPTNHIKWDDPFYYPINEIKLSPNPTSTNIVITQLATADLSIEVLDYLGRTVQRINSSELTTKVELENFSAGIYWFRIAYYDTVLVQQIIKTND